MSELSLTRTWPFVPGTSALSAIAVLGAQHAPAESWSVTHLPLQFDAAIVVSHVEVGDVWSCSVTEEIHGSVPLQPTT